MKPKIYQTTTEIQPKENIDFSIWCSQPGYLYKSKYKFENKFLLKQISIDQILNKNISYWTTSVFFIITVNMGYMGQAFIELCRPITFEPIIC